MIRKAKLQEIPVIQELVNAFAREELMLPVSIGDIIERFHDFFVAEKDGRIIGTVALHVTWQDLVEIRSLTVRREEQKTGLGRKLVEAALARAREVGAPRVFTLTYIPEFFEKLGFIRIDRAELPHKVWQDCVKCPKFPDCGEVALTLDL
jgi:amino-acid N-acetyltransferase